MFSDDVVGSGLYSPVSKYVAWGTFEDLLGNLWMSAQEETAVIWNVEQLVGVACNAVRRELKVHGTN